MAGERLMLAQVKASMTDSNYDGDLQKTTRIFVNPTNRVTVFDQVFSKNSPSNTNAGLTLRNNPADFTS